MDTLVKGVQKVPPRICIYGGHGIGKSTLASQFPAPIFISTEDGLDALDVTSFPKANVLADVTAAITALIKEDHSFSTVVVDSVDWLVEPLITQHIEANNDPKDLAYGKGAVLIAEEFRSILKGLDMLRRKRHMNVVLVAHASIQRFENPLTEPYDQFRPKLPARANALLQEWVDVLAFASFKVLVKKTDVGFNNTVTRGITTGERLLHLVEQPAFMAKNRYPGGADNIPMTINALMGAVPIVGSAA
jgi:hypothetical protein